MIFKLFYILYLIIAFLFPTSIIAGPVSIRHIMMLLMLALCVKNGIRWDKYMTLYTIFLFFFGLSSTITGYGGLFMSKLFGTFLQVYVFYFSSIVLIKKYDGENLLYLFFLAFGLLNAIVTIGQFFNLSFANRIVELLGVELEEDFVTRMERHDTMEGYALHGLVDSVRNGYFLSATAVVALYNKNGSFGLWNLVIWGVVIVASFLAQERTGFYVAVLLSFIMFVSVFYRKMKKFSSLVIVVALVAVLYYGSVGFDLLQSSDFRYAQGANLGSERFIIAASAWDYFTSNVMGAFYEYINSGNMAPHNVFVSMFLVGGVFGGMAVLILFVMQIVNVVKYQMGVLKKQNVSLAGLFSLMFMAYTLNSMTHNASIVYGTFDFFIFWGAFDALIAKERNVKFSVGI